MNTKNIQTNKVAHQVEYLRAKEAHKYLGIGLSTLWSFVMKKKITAYKISPKVTIFKKSELDAFINASVEEV